MTSRPAGRDIEVILTEADIREALTARRSLGREVFRDPFFGFLLAVIAMVIGNGGQFHALYLLSGLAVMVVLAGWYYWRREPRFEAEVAREIRYRQTLDANKGPLHVIIAREGLAMARGGKVEQLPWSARKLRGELEGVFLVRDDVLPKRLFSPAEIKLLRTGLPDNAAPRG
ncbi:hypothetical protein [Novosphingobium sp. 9]|uniref:hypothetical protein n=1 Tax=Novosphingobium sp. 9 TaxID=2025349 RepID=UPI0021B5F4D9|nr:hypothetical protein [Novosphingobium sp. 9]